MDKPDCYQCKWRGELVGNAHSKCDHPSLDKVKAHKHGIKSGWFFWPTNFDPVWLISCDGYTPLSKAKE